MKSENSKLLLGLGIGALVGAAVGYLMTGEHRRKLEEELREVGHGIKDGARSVFSKVKAKAEHAVRSLPVRPGNGPKRLAIKHASGPVKPGIKPKNGLRPPVIRLVLPPTTFLRKQMISGKRWTTGLRLMNKNKPNMPKVTGKT